MTRTDQSKGILFVSTYPPVKCGIASFTQDLTNAIAQRTDHDLLFQVCALNKKDAPDTYEAPVSMVLDSEQLGAYVEAAGSVNQNPSIDLVVIEHEFGLFGGHYGEYLLSFLELLEKPFVIRFHTVLPQPDEKRLKVVQKIGALAEKVLVMTHHSARLLREEYAVDPDKITIIPHGTHAPSKESAGMLKRKYDLEGKKVLTTFGLLSPNKGIETGIEAMREISKRFPDAVYVVLGLTHPNLLKHEGEKYRDYLQGLIEEYQLEDNVRLVNEYIPTERLMEYLALTDIYLFTSKDPNQAVSGTFLYAMSAGCAIISNSFVLADEMLNEKTGVTMTTNTSQELAEHAIRLLKNEGLRSEMKLNAFLKTRNTPWPTVAGKHIALLNEILERPVEMESEFMTSKS